MYQLFGKNLKSRFFLGTSRYPSTQVMKNCLDAAEADVLTVSLRRSSIGEKDFKKNTYQDFWSTIKSMNKNILPNTAGCFSVKEAVTTAQMAREFFDTSWIKLEVMGNDDTLQPDPFALVEAAKILCDDGFDVFPYMTEDLILAEKLLSVGCKVLMPWGSPIGSGRGIMNPYLLRTLRERLPEAFIVIDAGIGKPSHAMQAMEMGFDAVLLNTAVSQAIEPVGMAKAFSQAVQGGRLAYESGLMQEREMAEPSTPVVGTPFWHHRGQEGLL